MNGVQIRKMTMDDYEESYALWKASGLHLSTSDEPSEIARLLDRNEGLSFIAEYGGRIVGTVLGSFDGRRGYVRHLAVAEPLRNRGIGRLLMEQVETAFRERGVAQLNLAVARDNLGVLPFYERLGWFVREDFVPMSKRIDSEGAPDTCC